MRYIAIIALLLVASCKKVETTVVVDAAVSPEDTSTPTDVAPTDTSTDAAVDTATDASTETVPPTA